ncbi:hypothetical protein CH373_08070 [Leptospira perolatii]|uniref:Uncharacterized protein n=1 Tax=Leptospira perolatii TaxID=2023191 RepID=A0A2M9ZMZ3_9LEPT|nr:PRC-barrel domain-containing protein [Leptospira perolatii]PJZ68921.1 hypothetical protein CH360_13645 [Leptospira perolatii]PJZ73460.1 hypothetical protein CH373_08070 [Leptospira perolatii]
MDSDLFQSVLKRKLLLSILASITLLYLLLFNSITGQYLFDRYISHAFQGEIRGNVKKFSLLFGIRLIDVSLNSGPDWGGTQILKVKELEFSYNLPALFLGRLKISRIGLEGLDLDLLQKGSEWNLSAFFGPSSPKKKKEEAPLDEIRTYFPVSAYLHLDLKDINIRIRSLKSSYSAGMEGFQLGFELDTVRFWRIPLDLSILELIDDFDLKLNPERTVRIFFLDSSRSLDHPFRLSWVWQEDPNRSGALISKMDIGAEKIPLKVRNQLVAPFGFSLKYDLNVFPKEEEIVLKNLELRVNDDPWLEAEGKLTELESEDRKLRFAIQKSKIRLTPVSEFLRGLGLHTIRLNGEASLAPILIEGTPKDLRILGEIKGSGIDISLGAKRHSIPEFQLDWDGKFDFLTKEEPSGEFPLPWIKQLELKKLKALYNGFSIEGNLGYSGKGNSSDPKVDLFLRLSNFPLGNYVPSLSGTLGAELQVNGKGFSSLSTNLKTTVNGFRFSLGRGHSGNIGLQANLVGSLHFTHKAWNLEFIHLSSLGILASSPGNGNALSLFTSGSISLRNQLSLDLKRTKIETDLDRLIPALPLSLRESMIPVRTQIGNKISVRGDIAYSKIEKNQSVKASLSLDLPGLEISDGRLNVQTSIQGSPPEKIALDELQLIAFGNKFSLGAKGTFKRSKSSDGSPGELVPDISGGLKIFSKEDSYLAKGLTFKGDLGLNFQLSGTKVSGELKSNDSRVYVSNQLCPGPECKLYRVEGLNAKVPFTHDLAVKETKNLIEGNKRKYVLNYGRIHAPNFTIREILGTHPSLKGLPFEYVKPKGNEPGLEANLEYSENFLTMDFLKVFTLDGEILGKDVIVNVGSGDPEKMEYSLALRVKDIDLKQLLPTKSRANIDDGKIKADVNLSGRNLADPVPNLNLFFSVFQIGRDFGKSAINIVAPSNLLTDFIYTSYAVDKIELELSKGLVYAIIQFKRSVLGTLLINLENNQVSQQRMPLANFLKRAQSEIETFNK